MKTLTEIFENDLTFHCDKYGSYLPVYEQYFEKYRDRHINFVEVGIQGGGSLEMWKKYFGDKAKIIGIDVDPTVYERQTPGTEIAIGNQEDVNFWNMILPKIGPIHAFIDDGGHQMKQQINTLLAVWPKIVNGGVYICEDTHTSYWLDWGNGVGKEWTMMEFAKKILDMVNFVHWHEYPEDLGVLSKFQDVGSVCFYNSMIVFTKGQPEWIRPKPYPNPLAGR
jgi:cephalosporin hydroxylase